MWWGTSEVFKKLIIFIYFADKRPDMLMQMEYNQNIINDRQDDLDNINQLIILVFFLNNLWFYRFVVEVKDLMIQTADTVLNKGEVVGWILK